MQKICLIGCSGVLGREFCKHLDRKYDLVLGDLHTAELNSLPFNKHKKTKNFKVVDLENSESIAGYFDWIENHHPDIKCVILAAALTGRQLNQVPGAFNSIENYPLDIWEKTLRINLTAAFLVSQHVIRFFKKVGRPGELLFVGSIYGHLSPYHPNYVDENFSSTPAYSASKAGLNGLMKWLAGNYFETGVRVNSLVPGGVSTASLEKSFESKYNKLTPLGRMARPSDIAGALEFLVSDSSSYINGHSLFVDGGYSVW